MNFSTTKKATKAANTLVYGRSGVGKTRLCGTAPAPLIISSESGLLSLADKDIPVIIVRNFEDLQDAYKFVSRHKKAKKFKTICLDSLSDIAEAVLSDLKKIHRDPRQAYGTLNDKMSRLIRKFRDTPKNTYFIAKAEEYETESGVNGFRPSMPGNTLTRDLPYFFDIVLAMRIIKGKRVLQTAPTETWYAKDRSDVLSPVEKPDLTALFKKIKQE